MKILFIENRYKTALWEIIGKKYEELGHEVHWIVQNHLFKPSFDNVIALPYPKHVKQKKKYTPEIKKIIQADRGLNYFGIKSDDFIFWYQVQIENALDKIKPDLVFGESTLFHELLVINACKTRKILYLHPSSSRYPTNRFSFYQHDTLIPFGESSDVFDRDEAIKTAYAIGKRLKLPDYMNVNKKAVTKFQWFKDKLTLSLGYYLGEKYNTPSPFIKQKIGKSFAANKIKWENMATEVNKLRDNFNVLYALQMQPEANIDVWGHPYNNQAKVIEWIVTQLREDEKLIIKPNPKSKYEISDELLTLVSKHSERIVLLNHASKMDELWDKIHLVVTVTGTISIECIFDNKPIAMLGTGLQTKQKNCIVLSLTSDLNSIIQDIKQGKFPVLSENEKIEFLNELVSSSFSGINGDGLHNAQYLKGENLNKVIEAYTYILQGLDK